MMSRRDLSGPLGRSSRCTALRAFAGRRAPSIGPAANERLQKGLVIRRWAVGF